MSDPVGGREAERRAMANVLGYYLPSGRFGEQLLDEAIAALDVVRSSGSAAQNQEERLREGIAVLRADVARSGWDALERLSVLARLDTLLEYDRCWCGTLSYQATCKQTDCPRSPQSEDHDA